MEGHALQGAGTQITEDDVEEIALYPYKISNNTNVGCGYHLDCKVVVKCNKAINVVFYLQDADASGFAQYDAATYKLEKGIAQVAAPSKTPADEKTVNGVKYKFPRVANRAGPIPTLSCGNAHRS